MPPKSPAKKPVESEKPTSMGGTARKRKPHRRTRDAISNPPTPSDAPLRADEEDFEEALEEAFEAAEAEEKDGASPRRKTARQSTKKPAQKAKGGKSTKTVVARPSKKAAPKKKAASRKKSPAASARAGKSRGKENASPGVISELWGITLAAGALLVGCALVSFEATDTALSTAGPVDVKNWIGPGGAIVADFLTTLLGLGSGGVPLLLMAASLRCFSRRPFRLKWVKAVGAGVLLVSGATLLQTLLAGSVILSFPAGGLLGVLFFDLGAASISRLGTGIVAFTAFVGGLNLFSTRPLSHWIAQTRALVDSQIAALVELWATWRERRRLLLEEAEALHMELEERREQAVAEENERRDENALRVKKRAREMALKDLDDAHPTIIEERVPTLPEGPPQIGGETMAPTPTIASPDPVASKPPLKSDPVWAERMSVPPPDKKASSQGQKGQGGKDAVVIPLNQERPQKPANVTLGPGAGAGAKKTVKGKGAAADNGTVYNEPAKGQGEAPEGTDDALKIVERDVDGGAKIVEEAEQEPNPYDGEFQLPPLKLLDYDAPDVAPVDEGRMFTQAEKLVQKFRDFGIDGRVREIRPGPVVTTFEFVPAPGIKVSKIAALADDIAMAMEAIHVRIVAPIPGKGAIGIELPNEKREMVFLKEIVADPDYRANTHPLSMAMGKDIEGKPYFQNLAEMPHVLISGTTGSGKSVSVNAMICSMLFRAPPDQVRFLMIDPKMLELNIYDGIPHLLLPPITDSKKAALALRWAVEEMERRYQCMSEMGVRDISGYNEKVLEKAANGEELPEGPGGKPHEKFPYIVVVVDEYADLITVAGKDVETYVMRLAQKARACGIHVMLATQRPSVDVITGVIKSNFPVRMGFRLASSHDSKTIVNSPGAEKLLGKGDMLIMPAGTSDLTRVHGAYISEKELHRVVDFLKGQGKPDYNMDIVAPPADESGEDGDVDETLDARYHEALQVVARTKKCSTSWLQRQMGIGYNRAARIVESLERNGAVGPILNAKGDREIFVQPNAVEGEGRVF
jgi:S-DNA-T family DNA segregation ATPase FtsK/SpoIIIE